MIARVHQHCLAGEELDVGRGLLNAYKHASVVVDAETEKRFNGHPVLGGCGSNGVKDESKANFMAVLAAARDTTV